MKDNNIIRNALILCLITLIGGFLMGTAYELTKEPIREQEELTRTASLNAVLSQADGFLNITYDTDENAKTYILEIVEGRSGDTLAGYAFIIVTKEGYGSAIRTTIGINANGQISGLEVLEHSETPGLGSKITSNDFISQYVGKSASPFSTKKPGNNDVNQVDAITSATISTEAINASLNTAISYYENELKTGGVIYE